MTPRLTVPVERPRRKPWTPGCQEAIDPKTAPAPLRRQRHQERGAGSQGRRAGATSCKSNPIPADFYSAIVAGNYAAVDRAPRSTISSCWTSVTSVHCQSAEGRGGNPSPQSGRIRRRPGPPPSASSMKRMPEASRAFWIFTRVLAVPVISLPTASMRLMVARPTDDRAASSCWLMPIRARAARIWQG